jgi:hypothetical protein
LQVPSGPVNLIAQFPSRGNCDLYESAKFSAKTGKRACQEQRRQNSSTTIPVLNAGVPIGLCGRTGGASVTFDHIRFNRRVTGLPHRKCSSLTEAHSLTISSRFALFSVLVGMCSNSHIAPRLLKTREAARYLAVCPWKMRNLVQTGEIPCIFGDGTSPWLFDIQDLDNWIERRKQTL